MSPRAKKAAAAGTLELSELDQLEVARVEDETRRQVAVMRAARAVMGEGPVYNATAKQLRWLFATGAEGKDKDGNQRDPIIDADQYAGVAAAAKAAARAVDRATGHNPTGWHANGRDLAPLLERLESLLIVLGGTQAQDDEFQDFLDELRGTPAPTGPTPDELAGHA